jgi:ketosteroid isomerase-like protein
MTPDSHALETVRALESARVAATRANDVDLLEPLLDDNLIYITSVGSIFSKDRYLRAIRTHELTYSPDFDIKETENRVLGQTVILAGLMLGHARLDGEQQVFHLRCMAVWREQADKWRLVGWQSSSIWHMPP